MSVIDKDVAAATRAEPVTKHDTNTFATCRALYVGTGGDLVCQLSGDTAVRTYKNVPDGTILPVSAIKVTTASAAADILALY